MSPPGATDATVPMHLRPPRRHILCTRSAWGRMVEVIPRPPSRRRRNMVRAARPATPSAEHVENDLDDGVRTDVPQKNRLPPAFDGTELDSAFRTVCTGTMSPPGATDATVPMHLRPPWLHAPVPATTRCSKEIDMKRTIRYAEKKTTTRPEVLLRSIRSTFTSKVRKSDVRAHSSHSHAAKHIRGMSNQPHTHTSHVGEGRRNTRTCRSTCCTYGGRITSL